MAQVDENTKINQSRNVTGKVDQIKVVSGSPNNTIIQFIEHVRTVDGKVEEANIVNLTVGNGDLLNLFKSIQERLEEINS